MGVQLSVRVLNVVERDKRVFPRGMSLKYYPLVVKSARGYLLSDIEGREYIDFVSGSCSLSSRPSTRRDRGRY
jgi:4-aminobutyrate aminotransferase-like enzyme